jgi:hypothetical protein
MGLRFLRVCSKSAVYSSTAKSVPFKKIARSTRRMQRDYPRETINEGARRPRFWANRAKRQRSDSEATANKGFRSHNIPGASWADDHRFFPSEDNDAFFECRKLETKGSIRFHQDTTSDDSLLAKDQSLAWEQFESPSSKTPYGAAYVNVLKWWPEVCWISLRTWLRKHLKESWPRTNQGSNIWLNPIWARVMARSGDPKSSNHKFKMESDDHNSFRGRLMLRFGCPKGSIFFQDCFIGNLLPAFD